MRAVALAITRGATRFVQPGMAAAAGARDEDGGGDGGGGAAMAAATVAEAEAGAPAAGQQGAGAGQAWAAGAGQLQRAWAAAPGAQAAPSPLAARVDDQQAQLEDEFTLTEEEEEGGQAAVQAAAKEGGGDGIAGVGGGPFAQRRLHAASPQYSYVGAFVPIYVLIFSSVFFFANV
jgi:hypothetical protein